MFTGVDPKSYIVTDRTLLEHRRIPKIIHQTWKDENIPQEWQNAQESCRALHPDYEYKLWTDASSREFIAKEHPNLLKTWDSYPYVIQRADIIRFHSHHNGAPSATYDSRVLISITPNLFVTVPQLSHVYLVACLQLLHLYTGNSACYWMQSSIFFQ